MNEHLDLEQLADVLSGDDAARPHLADCERCRAALGRLEQALPAVASALAALPLPAQPAVLDRRLEEALRPAPVSDLDRHRSSRWLKPLAALTSVAAAAALVFGGIVVLGNDKRGGTDGHTAATGAENATRTSSTGSAYRKDGKLLAQQLPALLSGSAQDAAVPGPLLATKDLQPGSSGARAAEDPLARLRTTEGLAACITALTPPGQVMLPEALDYATFEGTPALVVVLPSPKAGRLDVFVVGPGCAAADAAVLYFGRLDRP